MVLFSQRTSPYQTMLSTMFATLVFFAITNSASAADLSISPPLGSVDVGDTFTAEVQIVPRGDSIIAAEATISFDTENLSVVSISKNGSAFSLWTTEPTFSNSEGIISFAGAAPAALSTDFDIVTIVFQAVAPGFAAASFVEASLLSPGGTGSNALTDSRDANYTIVAKQDTETTIEADQTSEPVEVVEAEVNSDLSSSDKQLVVSSVHFADPDLWYNRTDGVMTWQVPDEVSSIAAEVSTSTPFIPQVILDDVVNELALQQVDLNEGVQYFNLQFKDENGWGTTTHRQIKIDVTNPEPFVVTVLSPKDKTAFPSIVFQTEDLLSGVATYEVRVPNKTPVRLSPQEAQNGYLLSDLTDGTYTVSVTAYDQAGNATESLVPVLVTAGWSPFPVAEQSTSLLESSFGTYLLLFVLCIVLFMLLLYIVYTNRATAKKEETLLKETREIQDQMEKIFSALRDEIYDQINIINQRPRMSKSEKEAVDSLNQALEVSETLIEKEINDVKKILK